MPLFLIDLAPEISEWYQETLAAGRPPHRRRGNAAIARAWATCARVPLGIEEST